MGQKQACRRRVFWLVLLVLAIGVICGCGGGGSKAPAAVSGQTYTIEVTALSGTIQHSSSLQLTIGN